MQRGSTQFNELDKVARESDEDQQVGQFTRPDSRASAKASGFRLGLYSRSLALTMRIIFLLSWLAQSIAAGSAYNGQQLSHRQDPVSWFGYITSANFWGRTLQNWQSEFLAVGSIAIFAVYLHQRGSSESKPVGARTAAQALKADLQPSHDPTAGATPAC